VQRYLDVWKVNRMEIVEVCIKTSQDSLMPNDEDVLLPL